jgi:acyl-CoA synthetase (AMP-forming)/AMP-acid ligase II
MSFNLATILRESSNAHPHQPLCHLGEHTFSYAQVDEISGRIATSLRALGVGRGDKVAVQLPNMPHFFFAYFGILKVGAVLVPLNPLLRAPEICSHLINCDARLLITFETLADEALRGAVEIDGLPMYVVKAPINAHLPAGIHHFDELYFAEDTEEIEPTDADETAVIVYTSGTTGKPKAAELTHLQLYVSCTGAGEPLGFHREDIGMAVLPLVNVVGLSSVLNASVRFGPPPWFWYPVSTPEPFSTN